MNAPRYNFDPLNILMPENVPARNSEIHYITKLRCQLERKFGCAGTIPTPMDGGSVARGHGWPERPMVFTRQQAINVIRGLRLKLA